MKPSFYKKKGEYVMEYRVFLALKLEQVMRMMKTRRKK